MNINKRILEINKKLTAFFGLPKRNKKLPDAVDLLIATILSQNTNDKNSFQAYQRLKLRFPEWEDAAKANRLSIEKEIRIAGLGVQKSKAIKEFLKGVIKKRSEISLDYLSRLSNTEALKELINFKGIGIKTASCVLLFALDRNVCPVDTHVHRTLNRIGLVNTSNPDKTYTALNGDFPEKVAHSFHTNLIRLGREICKPSKPLCIKCPLLKICSYSEKNLERNSSLKEKSFMLLDNI